MPPCKETNFLFKSIAQNNKKADVIYNGMLQIDYQLVTDYPYSLHFFCYINTLNTEKFYIRANNSTNQCNNCFQDCS